MKNNEIKSNKGNKNKNEDNLSLTKQQCFNFETNEIEYEINSNRSKNKSYSHKGPIIIEKKVYPKFLISILIIIILFFCIFTIYHFITFNHNKVKIKEIEVTKKLDNNYVFVGDSITYMYNLKKYYGDMPVVNSGGDGNTTSDILNDIENRIYRYNPSKIFILIGTNDIIYGKNEKEIVQNIEKIIKKIKQNRPSCEIYLESIYPINSSSNEKININMVKNRTNEIIRKINIGLEDISKELDITYINMYDELIDEDGNLKLEYTTEGLHMTDDGYKVITKVLKSYIE